MELSAEARRVLGCLVEKALATPQQYPLSIAALGTACNQLTGRDPVVAYIEADVRRGLDDLKANQLTKVHYPPGSRVPKYVHLLAEQLDLDEAQQAVLALLLLRGPQTIGELRSRADRMHAFDSLEGVTATLASLAEHRFGPFATELERVPGQKETRWAHTLGGGLDEHAVAATSAESAPGASAGAAGAAPGATAPRGLAVELDELRAEVARLGRAVAQLQRELGIEPDEDGAEAVAPRDEPQRAE